MEMGWKEDEDDNKWIGSLVQLVSVHQMMAPNMPVAQSVN